MKPQLPLKWKVRYIHIIDPYYIPDLASLILSYVPALETIVPKDNISIEPLTPRSIGYTVFGKKEGTWITFARRYNHSRDGTLNGSTLELHKMITYENDVAHGPYIEYTSKFKGVISPFTLSSDHPARIEGKYRDGYLHGRTKIFYGDNMMITGKYKRGQREGIWKAKYEVINGKGGKMSHLASYKDGHLHGKHCKYNEEEKIVRVETYHWGQRTS